MEEFLVERTIQLLLENGVLLEDVKIISNDQRFSCFGVEVLSHKDESIPHEDKDKGYWLYVYYQTEEPIVYLHGDVYFTPDSISEIVAFANQNLNTNTLTGNKAAMNPQHYN